ncbi:hypothetical protein OEB96_17280 [Paraliomyxa miuraensis]|nr:hypothetical protein [Paraliomyxa miuraensis]
MLAAACSGTPESADVTTDATDATDATSAATTQPSTTEGGTAGTTTDEPAPTADASGGVPSKGRVLMVVAFNHTWWAEYKVMAEGLAAAGYEVEVRSSTDDAVARSYGERVDATPAGVPGVDPLAYEDFRARFEASFGVAWDPVWDEPTTIALDGRVQDAAIEDYVGLVFPGGSGSQHYRYDGEYEDLVDAGGAGHVSPADDVASAAAAINTLVVDALVTGRPVLAVCHAGPTPGFVRVPGTEGQGPGGLGSSILQGRRATGFPLDIEVYGAVGDVAEQYQALGIEFARDEAVVVDGPIVDLDGDGTPDGEGLVVTARSWYPEEVVAGLDAMLEILEG